VRPAKVFALPLPYVHLVKKLELPQSIVSGNKTPSGQVLEELRQKLTGTFLGLLDEAVHAIRLYHDSQSTSLAADDTGRASVPSYNVLLTSEHMHLIPRLREDTVEELHPAKLDGADEAEGDAAVTPQRLSINSLGFAGMLLAKSDAQSQAIKARGVVELLAQVGVPRVEDKSEGHSA
jgi:ATP adenylyltransferase